MTKNKQDANQNDQDWNKFDKNYYIAAGIGLVVFIITIVIIYYTKGSTTTWGQVIFYPLIVYFIFQQTLSGFGFITGYFPLAQDIIRWLSRTARKKAYNQEDIQKLEDELEEIEGEEKSVNKKIDFRLDNAKDRKQFCQDKIDQGKWFTRKANREMRKAEKKIHDLEKDKQDCKTKYKKEKDKIKKQMKEYRSKFSDKVLTRQEELEPTKFKLIMLIPIYVITIVGIILSIIGLINPIKFWITGTTIAPLDTVDIVNEYYKGIMAAVGIVTIYIVPAVRTIRDPSRFYLAKECEAIDTRRRFLFFRIGKRKADTRSILNRQFEDIRKYFFDIKTWIRRNLLIPMGLSMLIIAPIGGMSVYQGIKTGIRRKEPNKWDWIMHIVIAAAFICVIVPSYATYISRFLKNEIHPIISIIIKLIYITFLILSFVLYTRQPIARVSEVE
jgi:hypothetical protein